jgi:hypothetical protein
VGAGDARHDIDFNGLGSSNLTRQRPRRDVIVISWGLRRNSVRAVTMRVWTKNGRISFRRFENSKERGKKRARVSCSFFWRESK